MHFVATLAFTLVLTSLFACTTSTTKKDGVARAERPFLVHGGHSER